MCRLLAQESRVQLKFSRFCPEMQVVLVPCLKQIKIQTSLYRDYSMAGQVLGSLRTWFIFLHQLKTCKLANETFLPSSATPQLPAVSCNQDGCRPGKTCQSSSSGNFRIVQCPKNSVIRDKRQNEVCIFNVDLAR